MVALYSLAFLSFANTFVKDGLQFAARIASWWNGRRTRLWITSSEKRAVAIVNFGFKLFTFATLWHCYIVTISLAAGVMRVVAIVFIFYRSETFLTRWGCYGRHYLFNAHWLVASTLV